MSLKMTCPNLACALRYSIPEAGAGRSIRCKGCGETFIANPSATVDAGAAKRNAPDSEMEPAWDAVSSPSPASPPPPVPMPSGGNTVGRFVIRGKLGAGAFGTVYRAYDPQLDRVVALKVPNPGVMADAKRAERFLREAKAAANLRHPHIVPVFDAGQDGDTCYIACAFIDGAPLSDTIDERGTDFPRAARLARELADALAYAHDQGIVHRDVKPQNIMLDAHDRVHLMDFGLASRQDEAAKLTNDGAVMGTPAYMAPEQAAGQKGEAQPAADQYAAGVVLYELLTGRTPFTGPLAVVMHNVIHTEPDPPRTFRPYVPKDLETICQKAMAKQPEQRYADCQALADDLRRWMEGEPITARALGVRERATRWVKKEPKLSGAIAVIALVLLVSVVLVLSAASRAERDAADARAAETRAEDALAEVKAAREREDQAVGATSDALGTAAQEREKLKKERKKAEAFQTRLLEEEEQTKLFQTQAADERKKVEALIAQERQKAQALQTQVEEERGAANTAQAALELARAFALQAAYQAYLQNGTSDEVALLLKTVPVERRGWEWRHVQKLCSNQAARTQLKVYGRCALHPNESCAVEIGNPSPRVWDANSGAALFTLKGHTGLVTAAAFSPDGEQLVTASEDKTARVWNAKKSGPALFTLKGHTELVTAAAFSPDGKRIVTFSNDRTARMWDTRKGAELVAVAEHFQPASGAAFSPDGERIVTVEKTKSDDKTARVRDAKSGAVLFTLKGHAGSVTAAAYNPDGERIVTAGEDNTVRVWDAKTGLLLFTFNVSSRHDRGLSVAWNSDGSKLFIRHGDTEVLQAGPAPPAAKP